MSERDKGNIEKIEGATLICPIAFWQDWLDKNPKYIVSLLKHAQQRTDELKIHEPGLSKSTASTILEWPFAGPKSCNLKKIERLKSDRSARPWKYDGTSGKAEEDYKSFIPGSIPKEQLVAEPDTKSSTSDGGDSNSSLSRNKRKKSDKKTIIFVRF